MNRWSTQDYSETTLYNTIMADTCLYNLLKPTECTAQRENPNVNDEHWVIMMCQCKFISCDKCTTLVRDVGNGGH